MINFQFFLFTCAVGIFQQSYASFINPYPKSKSHCLNCNADDQPLMLTPYLKNGDIQGGRKAAKVPPLLDSIQSFAGFFTVNETYHSNLFVWFFPSEYKPEHAPVVLWLQGGPGASSLFGTFSENGPFTLEEGPTLKRRSEYWSKNVSMIYIDNPVGTGFSFTRNDAGYARTEEDVGRDLYHALLQFFQLFPEYKNNAFFVAGESYAGKYVPAVAYTIHKSNPVASQKINLKGIAVGNGWVDPLNMIDYDEYLFQHGFIDFKTKKQFSQIQNNIKSLIVKQKYNEAFWMLDNYIDADLTGYPSTFQNITGITNYYNYLNQDVSDDHLLIKLLNQPEIRRKIHVGNLIFNDSNDKVEQHLLIDTLLSIVPWLEVLMEHYSVLLYNGQLDIICAYPMTINYVRKMKWGGAAAYGNATRKQWHVGNKLAGYTKSAGRFTEVLVLDAGHMVPADQPHFALDLIIKFTFGMPF